MAWPTANTQPKSLLHLIPNRKWEPTGKFTPDGKPMWASREWGKNEKADYAEWLIKGVQQ